AASRREPVRRRDGRRPVAGACERVTAASRDDEPRLPTGDGQRAADPAEPRLRPRSGDELHDRRHRPRQPSARHVVRRSVVPGPRHADRAATDADRIPRRPPGMGSGERGAEGLTMSAPGDLYRCPTCGASLSLEQLRGTDCPFCKTVFPHHGRANEQAALVNQIMSQQMAQQNPYGYGAPPPQMPNQYGAPPPQNFQNPYAQKTMNAQRAAEQWQGAMKKSMTMTIVPIAIVFGGMILVGAIVAVALVMR